MNKEEMEKIVNDINDALWHLKNNKCNIDTKENSRETYYGLNDELIRYIRKIEQENKQLKEKIENMKDSYETDAESKYYEYIDRNESKLQQRIDKAIEYLEQPYRDNFDFSKAMLLEILKGE